MKVIIIGANSVISKALILELQNFENIELFLYTTNEQKCKKFIETLNVVNKINIKSYQDEKFEDNADIIINCVGVGTPKELNGNYTPWFTTLEKFDNKCIEYAETNSNSLYISLSSGSVYGDNFTEPADECTKNEIDVNNMGLNNFYSISKLYSEAKHRAFKNLNIVDLRIFSFFCRYSDLNSGYFMSDLVNSIKNKTVLSTKNDDIIRDYVCIKDMLGVILSCNASKPINCALDVVSKKPVNKFDILKFARELYNLEYEFSNDINCLNSSGQKKSYYSINNKYERINFSPKYTSEQTIINELNYILGADNN